MSDWTEGAPDRLRVGMQVRVQVDDTEPGAERVWLVGDLDLEMASVQSGALWLESPGRWGANGPLGHVIAWRQLVEVPE